MKATRKYKVGAVSALAAAAIIAPMVAWADETPGDDTTASVGSSAGQAPTRSNRTDRIRPGDSTTAGSSDSGNTGASAPATDPSAISGANDSRASTDVVAASPTADATLGANPLFQNPLIWFGQPNPTPPPAAPIYDFRPLDTVPGFSRPMFGWMEDFEFEACVLGLSTVNRGQKLVGPYWTSSTSLSGGGCA